MRSLTKEELTLVSGADGDEVETCEALGDAAGLAASATIIRRVGTEIVTLFNADLANTATDALVADGCVATVDWVGDSISSLEGALEDAGDYLLMFRYYQQWASPL